MGKNISLRGLGSEGNFLVLVPSDEDISYILDSLQTYARAVKEKREQSDQLQGEVRNLRVFAIDTGKILLPHRSILIMVHSIAWSDVHIVYQIDCMCS